jgi:outer membrane protein TolC
MFRKLVIILVSLTLPISWSALSGCAAVDLSLTKAPPIKRPAYFDDVKLAAADAPIDSPKSTTSDSPLLPQPTPDQLRAFVNCDAASHPIDLATALRLADARNPLVAFTRQQVCQAYAQLERADVLWLPSIRAGAGYNHHDGSIQRVEGDQVDTSRNDLFGGLGASPYGVGSPIVPGVWANFQLADAIFQPLAAQQAAAAKCAAAGATLNDTLLKVATAYLDLLRAEQDLAIALETQEHASALDEVTQAYAQTGQGLQSDADRTATELSLRKNNVVRAQESVAVASARLAQLLHLNPAIQLEPIEPVVAALDLTSDDQCIEALIAQAISSRPELAESRHLICEAIDRLRREQVAPLVPNVMLGVSDGGMAGSRSSDYAPGHNRFDMDAIAYWELRNFGFGDQAARREARSVVNQTHLRQVDLMDQVAREVTEAQIQVRARRDQIKIAEDGVRVASGSYQLNIQRIEQAQGLPIEVLQSLQALDQARREYLRTIIDYNTAQFTLLRALGWPDRPVENAPCDVAADPR